MSWGDSSVTGSDESEMEGKVIKTGGGDSALEAGSAGHVLTLPSQGTREAFLVLHVECFFFFLILFILFPPSLSAYERTFSAFEAQAFET